MRKLTCPECGVTARLPAGMPLRCCVTISDQGVSGRHGSTCVHRGEVVRLEPCVSCGGNVQLKVFGCSLHGECTTLKALPQVRGCQSCNDFTAQSTGHRPRPRYITSEQLASDTLRLIPKLPPDISCIVGVARSGVMPASLLAMHLHLPLYILDQAGEVRPAGHGWRLGKQPHAPTGPALIVDDTVGSGKSLGKTTPVAARHFEKLLYACIYVNPLARRKPDLWVENLWLPHLLEWNFPNSIVQLPTAFDLDGVICHDEHSGGEPGAPYLLPRRSPVHIITGRSERHREGTLAWLAKWGVGVASLTMRPDDDERPIADYKAEHVRRFASTAHQRPFGPPMYVESCPEQAGVIAELSGVLTVCPITRQVLGPEGCWL